MLAGPDKDTMTQECPQELLPFDTQDLQNLCAQFASSQFYYKMMKDSFISRYADSPIQEQAAGQGTTFPDQERTEQLDIRSLLLSQPKNVASELKFHKELFSKLKFNYVEQDSQEKFLKRVLEIPALFVKASEVQHLENSVAEHKALLKEKKKGIDAKKEELESLIDKEQELKALESKEIPEESIDQLQATIAERESAMDNLKREMAKWTDILDEKKESNAAIEQRISQLKSQRFQVETQASDAMRAAKNKDPQFEELCKWYTEVNSLLYKLNGIHEIRNLSMTEFEIDYESDGRVIATLLLKINPDADAHFKRLVNAKVRGLHCPIQDIVIHANLTISKLDEVVSFIVTSSRFRIYENLSLEREVELLSKANDAIVFDPETREVLVHVDSTGRAFVIRVKQGYPTIGWQGLEIVGIEPALQGDSEVELWQDKLVQSQVSTLSQLVPMLE